MTASDALVKNFLAKYSIPGATMALAKDGKIVYLRAFGYADRAQTIPTQPNNLFRIASLSKQITSITIMKLYEQGRLTMSSKVFGASGILKNHPVFSKANIKDARIYDITIQNLLEHSAGWNRDNNCNPDPTTPYPYFLGGCDPISFPLRVALLTGTPNPVTKEALIKFVLEKGLDFAPGTNYNYSNMGFLILGEVIETITGKGYEAYVKDSVLAPLGIYDMHIAKNRVTEKYEREGEYVGNNYTTLSIWGDNQYVPWEYGGFNITAMDAHGGWITTAKDLLKLLVAVDGFSTKPDMLKPATINLMTTPSATNQYYAKGWQVNSYNNWWHTGALDGTASEQVRAANGYSWVIITNKRDIKVGTNFWADLDNLGWNCIAATTKWSANDYMTEPNKNAANITFSAVTWDHMTINWTNGDGGKRLVIVGEDSAMTKFPLDGTDYTANTQFGLGDAFGNNRVVYNGTGNTVTITGLKKYTKYFVRVVEYNKSDASGNNAIYQLGNNPQASKYTAFNLPVTITSFTAAKLKNNTVQLNWQTAQELNSDFYAIERSGDGDNFTSIGTVKAGGNSAVRLNYNYTDEAPLQGKNYYRLKAVDKDGSYAYSTTRVVEMGTTAFSISPNPARNMVNINGATGKLVQVVDASGKVLVSRPLKTGNNSISVAQLANGLYTVKIISNSNEVEVHKLVIQQ